MRTRIQKWGNSLAFRIPKSFALNIRVEQNDVVDLTVEEGKLVIAPVKKEKYSLEELLEGISDENLHGEWDAGEPVGRESW